MKTKTITNILLTPAILVAAQPALTFGESKKKSSDKTKQNSGNPAETALWSKATSPFALAEMQNYLEKYPKGKNALTAKQIIADEKIIEDIETNGVGDRFVGPKELWPKWLSFDTREKAERGRTSLVEAPKGTATASTVFGHIFLGSLGTSDDPFAVSGRPSLPCTDRSVFVVTGRVGQIAAELKDPIRLVYFKNKGFVYIGGRGKIQDTDGKIIFQSP